MFHDINLFLYRCNEKLKRYVIYTHIFMTKPVKFDCLFTY